MPEGGGQLLAPSSHVLSRGTGDLDGLGRRDEARGLAGNDSPDSHPSGFDQGRGLRSGRRQRTPDQLEIESTAHVVRVPTLGSSNRPDTCHAETVPSFIPFRGHRFTDAAGRIEDLVSPPYDVFGPIERERLASLSPHNVVHVDYPLESAGPERYRSAAVTFGEWCADGTVSLDATAGLYLYRMQFTDDLGSSRSTVGVIGGLGLSDDDVLPHEQTTPKAKSDRLDLLEATGVNLSPIWGLSLSQGLTALLDAPGRPLVDIVDPDGVRHRLELVDDRARLDAISGMVSTAPVLIADGHHRLAVSRAYMAGAGSGRPGATHAMTYVAELTESQLSIAAIHRLLDGVSHDELLAALVRTHEQIGEIEVSPETLTAMRSQRAICLVRPDHRGTLLRLRDGALAGIRPIDSARLEAALADTGVSYAYQHGVTETLARLDSDDHAAAVLINPVPISQIRDVAVTGQLMPPKSTFFTPKLVTGLVMRDTAIS